MPINSMTFNTSGRTCQSVQRQLSLIRRWVASFVNACLLLMLVGLSHAALPPVPELLHYTFDETGTSATNRASSPPANTAVATLRGAISQNSSIPGTHLKAVVGSGISSNTDYVDTGYATNLSGSWSISFFTSNIQSSSSTSYMMGDINAGQIRIFTGGVAGPDNWLLRGPFADVYANQGALTATTMTAFVHDSAANEIRAYVNGVLVSTVSQSPIIISGVGPFKVGGYSTSSGLNAGGLLGDVRVYAKALTPAEISDIYSAATVLPQTLTFAAAPVVPVAGSANVIATSSNPNSGNPITYSTTSTDCSVTSAGVVTGVNAGVNNCTMTAHQQGVTTAPGFEDGSASLVFSIAKASQTINFPAQTSSVQTFVAGGTFAIDPVATASSGLPVSYISNTAMCTVSGTTVTMVAVGQCEIMASQAGSNNYAEATPQSQSVQIMQAVTAVAATPVPALNGLGLALLSLAAAVFGALNLRGKAKSHKV